MKQICEDLNERLVSIHQRRLDELGPVESGLYAHYEGLLGRGMILRPSDVDRISYIVRHLPPFETYVCYRAGLGEIGFALAALGRNVILWEPEPGRRRAIQEGLHDLQLHFTGLGDQIELSDAPPTKGALRPPSLGVAIDLLVMPKGADEAAALENIVRTDAILFDPRLFLRVREVAAAEGEADALLRSQGYNGLQPTPLPGLSYAERSRSGVKSRLRFVPDDTAAVCEGVFEIVGSSYSGSTLLNLLLGSHPDIGGGGELHWLVEDPTRSQCAICGEDCPVWTPQVRSKTAYRNIYDVAADAHGRRYVSDASKTPEWFKGVSHLHREIRRTRILLVKHPVRHVASFVQKAELNSKSSAFSDPDYVLDHLTEFYRRVERAGKIDVTIRYEDLVRGPREVVSSLLGKQGLRFHPNITEWQTQKHHYIGGNAGPRTQVRRSLRPASRFLERKYEQDGIFLDDTYVDVLDKNTIEAIITSEPAQLICTKFGYSPNPLHGSSP